MTQEELQMAEVDKLRQDTAALKKDSTKWAWIAIVISTLTIIFNLYQLHAMGIL